MCVETLTRSESLLNDRKQFAGEENTVCLPALLLSRQMMTPTVIIFNK